VPVLVRYNSSRECRTVHEERFEVVSRSVQEAINAVRDTIDVPEVEVYAWGPRGGKVTRYVGWWSYIANGLGIRRAPVQSNLFNTEQ
jgi:hypothetical protein